VEDIGSVRALFWALMSWNLVFWLGSFACYFSLKLLKCFMFLPPRVCPLVNLPSIKGAGPTVVSLTHPKN
jgi:hypothetical protein